MSKVATITTFDIAKSTSHEELALSHMSPLTKLRADWKNLNSVPDRTRPSGHWGSGFWKTETPQSGILFPEWEPLERVWADDFREWIQLIDSTVSAFRRAVKLSDGVCEDVRERLMEIEPANQREERQLARALETLDAIRHSLLEVSFENSPAWRKLIFRVMEDGCYLFEWAYPMGRVESYIDQNPEDSCILLLEGNGPDKLPTIDEMPLTAENISDAVSEAVHFCLNIIS